MQILFKPGPQKLLAFGRGRGGRAVVAVGAVLDAPAVPLAECVVRPVPAVFFEDRDTIAEVVARAVTGRPARFSLAASGTSLPQRIVGFACCRDSAPRWCYGLQALRV